MSILYLIRHGQASFGQHDYDRLSKIGREQSRIVAEHLCRLGTHFDAVYTGTLTRQQQTYEAVAEVYTRQQNPLPAPQLISEMDEYDAVSVWQHLHAEVLEDHPELADDLDQIFDQPKAFQRFYGQIVDRWVAGNYRHAGLESWPEFRTRVREGLQRIMQTEGAGKRVAVFSSAGPVAVAVQLATGMPDAQCVGISWQVLNAGITRFLYNTDQFTLAGFNDVAALEMQVNPKLLTYR